MEATTLYEPNQLRNNLFANRKKISTVCKKISNSNTIIEQSYTKLKTKLPSGDSMKSPKNGSSDKQNLENQHMHNVTT